MKIHPHWCPVAVGQSGDNPAVWGEADPRSAFPSLVDVGGLISWYQALRRQNRFVQGARLAGKQPRSDGRAPSLPSWLARRLSLSRHFPFFLV